MLHPQPCSHSKGQPCPGQDFYVPKQSVFLPWSSGEILKAPPSSGKGAEELL